MTEKAKSSTQHSIAQANATHLAVSATGVVRADVVLLRLGLACLAILQRLASARAVAFGSRILTKGTEKEKKRM